MKLSHFLLVGLIFTYVIGLFVCPAQLVHFGMSFFFKLIFLPGSYIGCEKCASLLPVLHSLQKKKWSMSLLELLFPVCCCLRLWHLYSYVLLSFIIPIIVTDITVHFKA